MIRRIARGVRTDSSVVRGIGDDCAVLKGARSHPHPPLWNIRTILRLILLVILLAQVAFLVQWSLIRAFELRWVDENVLTLGNALFLDLVVVLGAGYLLLREERKEGLLLPGIRRIQKVNWSELWSQIRFGVGSYLTFLPFMFLLLLLVGWGIRLLGHDPPPQQIMTMFMTESRAPVLGWMLILVAIVGPVAEEMFFRGVLYGWLRVRVGVKWGLIVSAMFFALLHANAVVFLPILALGLLFGWIYEQTGSLAAPIAIHILHNTWMLAMASLIKSIAFSL